MSGLNGVSSDGRVWDGREPLFRDVPFEQSEWAGLYEVLKQVNQLKAELMRAQYEAARTAYQNYREAREQEIAAYAQRRREDEAFNREVQEKRQQIIEQINAIRARWKPELDRLLEELEPADVEAYRRAGLAGITLRGDPLLGIGLPDEIERGIGSSGEVAVAASENATPPMGGSQAAVSETPTQPPSAARESLWSRLLVRGAKSLPSEQDALPAAVRGARLATDTPADTLEPLTPEEAAHHAHLPTEQSAVIPLWLHWVAPVLIGLAFGQIVLVAAGRPVGDWETLAFWIASLAGVMTMLLWYRGVWGMSRALSELYYLFDWGAVKARRAAWLGGFILLLLIGLPLVLLVFTLYQLLSAGTSDPQLLATLTLLILLPLLGVALVGGYLQGRAQVVRNAVQSAVIAWRRLQQQEAREQARQEQAQQARLHLEQETQRTEQRHIASELERERLAHERQHTEPSSAAHSEGNSPPNGASATRSTNPPPLSPTDPYQRLRDAFEAISTARGIYANYRRAQELMEGEIALYEQMLNELQLRPIYEYLPPRAEQRIATLYNQWRGAYSAFLDYIAEAVRECKDSEQIQQQIHEFKQTLIMH
ncbi:MAG: hypothetical protein ACK4P5_02810 [Fimbriimonadales bacterium]